MSRRMFFTVNMPDSPADSELSASPGLRVPTQPQSVILSRGSAPGRVGCVRLLENKSQHGFLSFIWSWATVPATGLTEIEEKWQKGVLAS